MKRLLRVGKWTLRIGKWTVRIVFGAIALAVIALWIGTRTERGQRFAVGMVIDRLESRIQGRVSVGAVRSADLLGGGTITQVEVVGLDGRPILTADSVRIDFALLSLLGTDLEFDAVTLWGADARVERLAGDSLTNVQKLLAPPPATLQLPPIPGAPPRATSAGPTRIAIGQLVWVGGGVQIALSADEPDIPVDALTELAPDGGVLRLFSVDDVALRAGELILAGRTQAEPIFFLDALAAAVRLTEAPFQVDDLAGPVWWDDGLIRLRASNFALPGSRGSGELRFGSADDEPRSLYLNLDLETLDLADLTPLSGELLDATVAGHAVIQIGDSLESIEFDGASAEWAGGTITGVGSVEFVRGRPEFGVTDLTLSGLPLDEIAALRDTTLPIGGRISGPLRIEGPLTNLFMEGQLDLDSPEAGGPVGIGLDGRARVEPPYSANRLEVTLNPFRFELVGAVVPSFRLHGAGRVVARVDGGIDNGLTLGARITHSPVATFPTSIVDLDLLLRRTGAEELRLETFRLAAIPLQTAALRDAYPSIPLQGAWRGTLDGSGPLEAFSFDGDVSTVGGPVGFGGTVNLTDPAASYAFSADVDDFLVSAAFSGVTDPTVVSGALEMQGTGLTAEDLLGTATVRIDEAQGARVSIGASTARLRAESGQLLIDSLVVDTEVGSIGGSGRLGLSDASMPGTLSLAFAADDLSRLQSIVFGDSLLVGDGLDLIQLDILRINQIDPDTLPRAEAYRIEGRAEGRAELTGSLRDFSAQVTGLVDGGAFQSSSAAHTEFTVRMDHLPAWPPPLDGGVIADSIMVAGRTFSSGQVTADYDGAGGGFDISLQRVLDEGYMARGTFEADSAGGLVRMDELELSAAAEQLSLVRPTEITWGDRGIRFVGFELSGRTNSPVRIRASGAVPVRGEANLQLDFEALSLERAAYLLQLQDTIQGIASGSLTIRGRRASPLIEGDLSVDSLALRGMAVDRVSGSIEYRERSAAVELTTVLDGRTVLTVTGRVPVDLTLASVADRIPEEPVDLAVIVDALPVSALLAYFPSFEQPTGTVSGQARIRGTPRATSPEGDFVVTNGGVRLEALGVVYRGIGGTFTLRSDGVVEVDVAQTIDGSAVVRGEIALRTENARPGLFDPGFDLTITGNRFLAVNRRDLTARVDGEVRLTGSYQGPSVTGAVTVTQGELNAEELIRAAEVVDPSDPEFRDFIADSTFAGGFRFVDLAPSPFLQKLRANVDITLDRGFRLTSREVNVDLEGALQANWDRVEGDLSLRGTLNTVRGSYTTFEKPFTVQTGTVQFVGVPGIDPRLDITAVNRVRLPDRAPLNIIAHLDGTLQSPRVRLSTDAEGGVSETDLISYLLFGQPSYQLTAGQNAQVTGAAGSFFGAAAGAGATFGLGAVAASFGSLAAQGLGVDQITVTQQQGAALNSDFLGSTVASTIVELGFYLERDWYISFQLRPLVAVGAVSQSEFAGATAEWTITDTWTLQLFYEDRFTRGRILGFGTGGVQLDKQGGFFLFKTWGY